MTTIQFQLSEKEAVDGMLKVRNAAGSERKVYLAFIVLLLLDVPLGFRSHQRRLPTFPIYLIFGGAAVVMLCSLPFLVRRAMAQLVCNNTALLTEPQEVSFNADRIVSFAPSLKQELAWSVFKKRLEDERYFYLYAGSTGLAAIVPKRAFDEVSLREFLRCSQSLCTV